MKRNREHNKPLVAPPETRVSAEEATQLIALMEARQHAEVGLKRAQIAYETAALNYLEVEQRVSRKYQLGKGDVVGADGRIVRAQ